MIAISPVVFERGPRILLLDGACLASWQTSLTANLLEEVAGWFSKCSGSRSKLVRIHVMALGVRLLLHQLIWLSALCSVPPTLRSKGEDGCACPQVYHCSNCLCSQFPVVVKHVWISTFCCINQTQCSSWMCLAVIALISPFLCWSDSSLRMRRNCATRLYGVSAAFPGRCLKVRVVRIARATPQPESLAD